METTANAQPLPVQRTVSVNGIELYSENSGKGEPLLLLHGWTQTSDFRKPCLPLLTSDLEVYAVDLRGHGRSSR